MLKLMLTTSAPGRESNKSCIDYERAVSLFRSGAVEWKEHKKGGKHQRAR